MVSGNLGTAKKSDSCFEKLPNEVLINIFELFPTPRLACYGLGGTHDLGILDLISIIKCSKRFQQCAEPILYREIIYPSPRMLMKLLDTLLGHTALFNHIRGLYFQYISTDTVRHPVAPWVEFQDQIRHLISLQNPARSLIGPWCKDISLGQMDASAAFLISILPDLQVLQINKCSLSFNEGDSYVRYVLSQGWGRFTVPGMISIPKLKVLALSYRLHERREHLLSIMQFLDKTSAETFQGDRIRNSTSKCYEYDLKLKMLHLSRSNIAWIQPLLKSCPRLTSLRYEHEQDNIAGPFFPRRFRHAFGYLRHTLEELAVYRPDKYGVDTKIRNATREELATIGSLVKFPKLKKLSITAHLLLGPQQNHHSRWWIAANDVGIENCEKQSLSACLPRSLEHVELRNCDEEGIQQVYDLLTEHREAVPELRFITLYFDHWFGVLPDGKWTPTRIQHCRGEGNDDKGSALEQLCREAGIDVQMHYRC
ncbi:hypothetical protein B0J14DRAFT_245923 [Halenospora varia]|nr:hypothetical protein B0J14DRAFT_245923 [Halenospora varia]